MNRRHRVALPGAMLLLLWGSANCAPQAQPPLLEMAEGSPIDIGGAPGGLALGDVDGDRKPDLVVVSGRGVTVLIGQGDGQFRTTEASPIALPGPSGELLLAELSGDGHLDLALGHHDTYAVMLLFGDGDGGFAIAPNSPVIMKEGQHPHTHGLMSGDLNGDGSGDLVLVNSEDHDVSVAFGDGKGGFTRADSPFTAMPSPYPGALADLNGDRNLDMVITSSSRRAPEPGTLPGALTLLFGDGHGKFSGGPTWLKTRSPGFVAISDINGDQIPDLVASHLELRELSILMGDGKGGFAEVSGSPFDLGANSWYVAITDLNGDAKADVAAASGDGVNVMLGDGRRGFQRAPGSPFATGKGTWQLAAGDVNGDGRSDVITNDLRGESVTVLLAR